MARNDVWRYTLRLFHTFALFETNRKIDAKREPNNYFFWWKMIPRAPKVWFILPFWLFFEGSKNHCCFDAFLGGQKIEKIRPWSAQGSPNRLQLLPRVPWPSLLWGRGVQERWIPQWGTTGGLPAGLSQPDDPGGVGGYQKWTSSNTSIFWRCHAKRMSPY